MFMIFCQNHNNTHHRRTELASRHLCAEQKPKRFN